MRARQHEGTNGIADFKACLLGIERGEILKHQAALGESLVEMLSDTGSTPVISTKPMALTGNGQGFFL